MPGDVMLIDNDPAACRRRGLTDSDRAIWASYARMVAPLPGVAAPDVPPPPPIVAAVVAPMPAVPVAPVRRSLQGPGPLVVGTSPGGVDAATWSRFRQGKLAPTRTLDLHGRTAQLAYTALQHFMHRASSEGVRCVEVITGRGKGEAGGVIRREFPLWLNQPHLRALVLAAAHPHALNTGSVRLLLRRARGRAG